MTAPVPAPLLDVRLPPPRPDAAPLLRAAARSVPARALGLHVVAAAVLVTATWSALDSGGAAVVVLRGVALVLAAGLALACEEPSAGLLDASPTTLAQRTAARSAVCAAALLPAWALAVAVVALRGGEPPVGALTLELAALAAGALAGPLALRRWWRVAEPALAAGPVLVCGLLAASFLPPGLALLSSPGPDWDAAHRRWAVLLLVAGVLLVRGLADPATARTRSLRRRP